MDADERVEANLRRSARAQGYSYIELRLKDNYKYEGLAPIKVHGVVEIKGVPGTLKQGRQQYRLFTKLDGVMTFKFNEDTAFFTAWIVVDHEPAKFGETGRNLDILVGHLKNKIWDIVDPHDLALVKERLPAFKKYQADYDAEKIRKKIDVQNRRQIEEVENLDAQEEALVAKLEETRKNKEKIEAKKKAAIQLAGQKKPIKKKETVEV